MKGKSFQSSKYGWLTVRNRFFIKGQNGMIGYLDIKANRIPIQTFCYKS